MALPKKGSRTITVDGTKYRYHSHGWRGEGEDFCELTIERAEEPRQKIRARYTFTLIQEAYLDVGHGMSRSFDTVPPYVTRQTILLGLERGWTPDDGGGLLNLGNLDEAIDFSGLRLESQDPLREE